MFANHEEDNKEVMELSEEEIPNITRPLLPKNKKRKFVDQTFEDEEGFTCKKLLAISEHLLIAYF